MYRVNGYGLGQQVGRVRKGRLSIYRLKQTTHTDSSGQTDGGTDKKSTHTHTHTHAHLRTRTHAYTQTRASAHVHAPGSAKLSHA